MSSEDVSEELERLDSNLTGLWEGRIPELERRLGELEDRINQLEENVEVLKLASAVPEKKTEENESCVEGG